MLMEVSNLISLIGKLLRVSFRLILGITGLKLLRLKCRTIEQFIDLAYSFRVGALDIRPLQIREEIDQLLRIISILRPKTLVEIGTCNGGTLFLFCQVADPTATIVSIDLPGGPFGGGYPAWKIPLYKSFARYPTQRIHLLRADSHNPNTLRKVREILTGKPLDFLFIDGDHTYEGVKRDFEMYSPLVRKGGVIAFHDIVEHPPETRCEVSMFWNEIKHGYKYLEIVKDWKQNWAGIGVIFV